MTRALLRALVVSFAVFTFSAPAFAGPKKTKATGSDTWVELPNLVATVSHRYDPSGILQVSAGLEIKKASHRAKAERLMPRLKAACAEAIRIYAADYHRVGTPPEPDRISDLIEGAVEDVLGQTDAKVLLMSVLIHSG